MIIDCKFVHRLFHFLFFCFFHRNFILFFRLCLLKSIVFCFSSPKTRQPIMKLLVSSPSTSPGCSAKLLPDMVKRDSTTKYSFDLILRIHWWCVVCNFTVSISQIRKFGEIWYQLVSYIHAICCLRFNIYDMEIKQPRERSYSRMIVDDAYLSKLCMFINECVYACGIVECSMVWWPICPQTGRVNNCKTTAVYLRIGGYSVFIHSRHRLMRTEVCLNQGLMKFTL